MNSLSPRFGFLPSRLEVSGKFGRIFPVDDFDAVVRPVLDSPQVEDGWYYLPAEGTRPPVRFELPCTHVLALSTPATPDDRFFLLNLLGVCIGLRLCAEGDGHFYRVKISGSLLTDLICRPNEIAEVLDAGLDLTQKHPQASRTLAGAIHWALLSQSYTLEFEVFMFGYMALDACCRAFCDKNALPPPALHATRIDWLCQHEQVKIPTPTWAATTSEIAKIRNNLVHEARYFGKPIGYAVDPCGRNLNLEMLKLLWRLVIAILDCETDYPKTSVKERMRHRYRR